MSIVRVGSTVAEERWLAPVGARRVMVTLRIVRPHERQRDPFVGDVHVDGLHDQIAVGAIDRVCTDPGQIFGLKIPPGREARRRLNRIW